MITWRIEVWVAQRGKGQWKFVDKTEELVFAQQGVKAIAKQYGVARALFSNPEEGGWCGMIAYRRRGFCCWTGSGGRYGG
jgi:hypothetical protein